MRGGGASHLRTRLRLENPLLTGKITERAWQPAQIRPEMVLPFKDFDLNSLRSRTGGKIAQTGKFNERYSVAERPDVSAM